MCRLGPVVESKEGPEVIVGQNRTSECFHAEKWQTQFCIYSLATGRYAHLKGGNSGGCFKSFGEEMTRHRTRPAMVGLRGRHREQNSGK